jgi:hypothetical protein
MRCRLLAAFTAVSCALVVGCGSKDTAATADVGPSGTIPSDPIARVVYEFFDAVRQGHTAEANKWLTPLALQRITEQQMNVTPPGSPTARFQVGPVKHVENANAVVELTWSDVDADGKRYTEPKMWCELRVCDGQWRICGMAQDLGPNRTPMVMDFESLQGIAPTGPAKIAPAAGAIAAPAAGAAPAQAPAPSQQMAQDPFQAPSQR